MNPQIFTKQFTVPSTAIDVRNHVNNLAYLEWFIEAAQEHWELRASTIMKQKYVWYVLQHVVDYKASAFLNEQLELKTWVARSEGVRSERQFQIYRMIDKKLLVTAKTTWCLLDSKSQRPTKITEEIRNLFID